MTFSEAYRTAMDMQVRFGEEAPHVAAERADACRRKGDADGFDGWNRICAILKEFERLDTKTAH